MIFSHILVSLKYFTGFYNSTLPKPSTLSPIDCINIDLKNIRKQKVLHSFILDSVCWQQLKEKGMSHISVVWNSVAQSLNAYSIPILFFFNKVTSIFVEVESLELIRYPHCPPPLPFSAVWRLGWPKHWKQKWLPETSRKSHKP